MEGAFQTSFSGVKLHTNSARATELGALALTQGSDIHFAPGQYDPYSSSGQELLAHELAHVVQQASGNVEPTLRAHGVAINDDEALEQEADRQARAAVRHSPTPAPDKGAPWDAAPFAQRASANGLIQRYEELNDRSIFQGSVESGGSCPLELHELFSVYAMTADELSFNARAPDGTRQTVRFTRDWVESAEGTAILRGRIRRELARGAGDEQTLRQTLDAVRGAADRVSDLRVDLEAAIRRRAAGIDAAERGAFLLEEAHGPGQNWQCRGYSADGTLTQSRLLAEPSEAECYRVLDPIIERILSSRTDIRSRRALRERQELAPRVNRLAPAERRAEIARLIAAGEINGRSRPAGRLRNHYARLHAALDIQGPPDTAVYSALPGRVLAVQSNHAEYGNVVRVEHPNAPETNAGPGDRSRARGSRQVVPVITNYCHLNRILVSPGQPVFAGQAVGLLGDTGLGGTHLHFSVQLAPSGLSSSLEVSRGIRAREWLQEVTGSGAPYAQLASSSESRGPERTVASDGTVQEKATRPAARARRRSPTVQRRRDDTGAMHARMAEDYRRWYAEPERGGLRDAQIIYSGLSSAEPLSRARLSDRLLEATVEAAPRRGALTRGDVRQVLTFRARYARVRELFEASLDEAESSTFELQMLRIENAARQLLRVIEAQRQRLSDSEWQALRMAPESQRRSRMGHLESPESEMPGSGGWLHYNQENLQLFRTFFDESMSALGLAPDDLLVLSSMMTQENPTFRELPPRDLWPNMQQTLQLLAQLRVASGVDFQILSAYRSDLVNALSGGTHGSAHEDFFGLDLRPSHSARFHAFIKYYWHVRGRSHRLGLGFYAPARVHVDTRSYRRWEWDEPVSASRLRYQTVFGNTPLPA